MCMVGHKTILSEILLTDTFWNNFKFYFILIIFSIIIGIIYVRLYFESIKQKETNYNDFRQKVNYIGFLFSSVYLFFAYSFLCSLKTIQKDEILKEEKKN